MEKLRFKDENGDNYPKWETVKFGEVLTQNTIKNKGNIVSVVKSVSAIYGFVNPLEIFSKKISSKDLKNYTVISYGDFAYNPSRINIGSVCMSNFIYPFVVSPLYVSFKLNKMLIGSYLINYFKTNLFSHDLNQNLEGSVRASLSFNNLQKLSMSLPCFDEQTKISNYFSNLDSLINNKKRQLELMEKYKEDLLDKIFNQKIRFKDENGCDYPEWEITKLSQISKSNIKNKELPKNFIYVDLTSVKKGTLIEENELNKNNCPDAASYNLEKNDILIARVRPYQQNNYFVKKDLKTKYVASNGFTHLRINKDHNPEFIYHLIHTKENLKYININSTGTTYPTISNKDLLNLKILLPIIEEQEKIANLFSNLDLKINVLKNSIKNLKEFKIDMLEKMF